MKFRNLFRIFGYSISIVIGACVISCNSSIQRADNLINCTLKLPVHNNQEFTIFRYIKINSCTSCQLQIGQWRVYKKKLKNRYHDNVKILFLIDTKNAEEAEKIVSMYHFSENVVIDTLGEFSSLNPHILPLEKDVVMLLDNNFSVKAIGNPCRYYKIDSIYNDIINSNVPIMNN